MNTIHNILRYLTIVFILTLSAIPAWAQNNTNSPYTRFGLGEMADYTSGRSHAMGGTSIGVRHTKGVNAVNPASYTAIDSLSFVFEAGASGKLSIFSDAASHHRTDFNGNVEFLTLRFPIGNYVAFSCGITPYSYVGYDFPSNGTIDIPGGGTIPFQRNYKGSGGLHQLYGGLALKIGTHFSLGANMYYLFGTINHSRQITYDATYGTFYSTLQESKIKVKDLNFRYGIQYYTPFLRHHYLSVGAILELKNELGGDYTVQTSTIDTVSSKNKNQFETPLTCGLGVSYSYKDRLNLAADLLWQGWNDANFFGRSDTLSNRIRAGIGAEYTPNRYAKSYLKRISYRLGANVSDGYLNIKGNGLKNYSLTMGFGLPARGRSMLNLGVEYGHLGNTSYGQISENYVRFNLSLSFAETWFFKRRFD